MATITLEQFYLHDAEDLAEYVAHPMEQTTWTAQVPAQRRLLAAGRSRVTRRANRTDAALIRLSDIATADVYRLEYEWIGKRLMMREPRGRVWWGFYDTLTVEEHPNPAEDLHVVSFTFNRLSGSPEL